MNDLLRDAMLPAEESLCAIKSPVLRPTIFEGAGDAALAAEGWQRRFVADTDRLAEYVELYTSLGLEVRTEKVRPEQIGPECADCRLIICRQFVTIYTRPIGNMEGTIRANVKRNAQNVVRIPQDAIRNT